MASSEEILAFDRQLQPHRSAIGEERSSMKEVYKAMRKSGEHPKGYKSAKSFESMKPTARAAALKTFFKTIKALGIDAQTELHLVHDADNQPEAAPTPARAKVPASMKPPGRGKVRGKGGLNRPPSAA